MDLQFQHMIKQSAHIRFDSKRPHTLQQREHKHGRYNSRFKNMSHRGTTRILTANRSMKMQASISLCMTPRDEKIVLTQNVRLKSRVYECNQLSFLHTQIVLLND
jgi:hypothetical protein